jgi:hypothetical protein
LPAEEIDPMFHPVRTAALAGLLTLAFGLPNAQAIQPAADSGRQAESARRPTRLFAEPALDALPSLTLAAQEDTLLSGKLAAFRQRHGGSWELRWDDRADRANVVQGSGVALIPGRGNRLTLQQFGLAHESDLNLGTVAAKARDFIATANDLLRIDDIDLRLDGERSVRAGGDNPVWFLEFGQYHKGVRVDGAFVYVRVAQGNVVQFGAERVADVAIGAQPALTREDAFARAWDQLGFRGGVEVGEFDQRGELRIYPRLPEGDRYGERYADARGAGYRHVLAWRYQFRVKGDDATWQVLVDAQDGHVIDARDLTVNVNATVTGGVYPTTNSDTEIVVPLPFVELSNGTTKITDTLGIYDYSGGTATATLNGKYFRMSDACGAISLANGTDGNLAFGTSAGTDCTTPGIGGAGNTHASRTGFYHLSRINEKARTFFPANTWLQGKVTASMNINNTCNASWNGSTLNFYHSGPHPTNPAMVCSNTGEIAAVFLHEWGHGMDTNTGGSAGENGSGEAVGDTFAFLETRDSCIGQNFAPGFNCHNCTNCTGVRDVGDFGLAASADKRASPANLGSDTGINCDRLACPYTTPSGQPYRGPMGYEGHCESYIASAANWDLTQSLIERFGASGWGKMDRIWYASLTPSKSAYRVASGGTCNLAASVDGCAATNWYTVFLPADDDDGNLANGTPNACRIWDAMNAHGIACGTRPACSGDAPDFRLGVTNTPQAICAPASATFNLNTVSDLGFTNAITLSATGNPSGSSVSFTPNPVAPGSPATMTVTTTGVAAGTSTLTINGAATASPGHSASAQLTVATGTLAATTLTAPANNATGISVVTPVTLSWAAIAGTSTYTVDVATDAAFAQIVASRSDLTQTSWAVSGLQSLTTYYWRVRAGNICGAGTNSSVFQFATAAMPGDCNAGQSANSVFSDNVEGDVSGWTASAGTGTQTWAVSTARPSSPSKAWLATDITTTSDQRLVSPAVALPTGENPLSLSFQSDLNLEPNTATSCYDGGLIEISTNGGTSWTQLTGAQLLTDPYTGPAGTGPVNGLQVWCGTRAYKKSVIDLNSYAGQTVRLRFRAATDSSAGLAPHGWYVDDIKVQSCRSAPADRIFANGFQP